MITFEICVSGCDDSTKFRMDLTHPEAIFLAEVAAATALASDYGCQPTLTFAPYETPEDFNSEWDSEPPLIKRTEADR